MAMRKLKREQEEKKREAKHMSQKKNVYKLQKKNPVLDNPDNFIFSKFKDSF